ncbi:MAG: hypothetical protein LBB21_06150 [Holosporaceae bacterium]|jgi:hypothetical protein|nr:hypothetical protein [Holosporaceae bacterium]
MIKYIGTGQLVTHIEELRSRVMSLPIDVSSKFSECILYRNIVVFANELRLDSEEFIQMVLKGGDPTKIKDGVIWSVDELKDRKKVIDEKNNEYFTDYFNYLYKICIDSLKLEKRHDESPFLKKANLIGKVYLRELLENESPYECLFRKIGYTSSQLKFPLAEDMFGKIASDKVPPFLVIPTMTIQDDDDDVEDGNMIREGGWKLHVSATPSSAGKVAKAVIPYLVNESIYFKIVPTANALRRLNLTSKISSSYSQYGKFITIYLTGRKNGAEIAKHIDDRLCRPDFTRKDFVTCSGDFSIGKSGAVSTRYVDSYVTDCQLPLNTDDQRREPIVPDPIFDDLANIPPIFPLHYCELNVSGTLRLDEDLSKEERDFRTKLFYRIFRENMKALGLAIGREEHLDPYLLQTINR